MDEELLAAYIKEPIYRLPMFCITWLCPRSEAKALCKRLGVRASDTVFKLQADSHDYLVLKSLNFCVLLFDDAKMRTQTLVLKSPDIDIAARATHLRCSRFLAKRGLAILFVKGWCRVCSRSKRCTRNLLI